MNKDTEPVLDLEVNPQNQYFCSPLTKCKGFTKLMMIVTMIKQHPELIDEIKNHEKDVDRQNELGWTALMILCRNLDTWGSQDALDEILKLKPNLNLQNTKGITALKIACSYINQGTTVLTIKKLLENGADPNIEDNDGNLPLHVCFYNTDEESNKQIVELLVTHNSKINYIKNISGLTPLMVACSQLDVVQIDTIKFMISKGANILIKNEFGDSLMTLLRYFLGQILIFDNSNQSSPPKLNKKIDQKKLKNNVEKIIELIPILKGNYVNGSFMTACAYFDMYQAFLESDDLYYKYFMQIYDLIE